MNTKKEFSELLKKGFQRVKVDGKFYEIADVPDLKKNFKHNIDVVIDRLIIDNDIKSRLADSFELATSLTDGLAVIEIQNDKKNTEAERILFSANYACPVSGFTIEEIEPRLFSFNNPKGACNKCDGLGTQYFIDEELVIPDKNLSINDGAIAPWSKNQLHHLITSRHYLLYQIIIIFL